MSIEHEATIADHIVAILGSARSLRLYRKILWERVKRRRKVSNAAFNQAMYRLRREGTVQNVHGEILLLQSRPHRSSQMIIEKPQRLKRILILFDIPEDKKKIRDWLRSQLKFWDFIMVQKSAWVGNGPLPQEFTKRLKLLGITKNIKIFAVKMHEK